MKKKNKNSIYNNLAEKFSAEEIAESYVFPIETSSSEQHVQAEEFIKMRMNRLEEMTETELLTQLQTVLQLVQVVQRIMMEMVFQIALIQIWTAME